MKNKKLILLLPVVVIYLLAAFVSPVLAADTLLYECATLTGWNTGTSGTVGAGRGPVIGGNNEFLTKAEVYLRNNSAEEVTGYLQVHVYACSGATPINSQNATHLSSLLDLSDLFLDNNGHWYEFTFAGTYNLTSGTNYLIAYIVNQTCSVDIASGYQNPGDAYTDNNGPYPANSWAYTGSAAVNIRVYTNAVEGGEENETYTIDPTVFSGGSLQFISFVAPLVVLLLPVMLLIAITKSTDKWIILIGLAIGAALGTYFQMIPLWVTFLIAIGLIGMAYQSVRGGG